MVLAFFSCCYFSSHCTVLCICLGKIRCGHENSSEFSNWAIDNLGIRSVVPCVFRHHYSLAMDYYWDRYRGNSFSSSSGNENWHYAYILILWLVTPHWKKPRILSVKFPDYLPFLYAPIGCYYLLPAWRTDEGLGCVSFLWCMSYFMLSCRKAGGKQIPEIYI